MQIKCAGVKEASSVGLVKSDLREKLLDSTTIDIMFAKHNKS